MSSKTTDYQEWTNLDIHNEINRRLDKRYDFGFVKRIDLTMRLVEYAPGYYLNLSNQRVRGGIRIWDARFHPLYAIGHDYANDPVGFSVSPARSICIAWLKWHDAHGQEDGESS